ncbi:MAG: histidinol dehydrogenase, partial [Rhizobium sp.]
MDRAPEQSSDVTQAVERIVADIRVRGDVALLELTNQFDRRSVANVAELEVSAEQRKAAWDSQPAELRAALENAAKRIRAYAEHQALAPFSFADEHGNQLGQMITPLDRAGLYVPGGKAAYPSSVLMNAIPAKVAGVREVIMVVPAPGGELNSVVLAAAHLAGVDRIFTVGGA